MSQGRCFLKKCEDIAIPKELNVEYCPKCRGYWFDKGEFKDLKENVEARVGVSSDFGNNITEYLKTLSNEGRYDTVERVSEILMKPYQVDNNWNRNLDDPEVMLFHVINTVIQVILRILLKI